jgi:acyl-CoA thioester hydrolase
MHSKEIEVRWRDCDALGHVNNAVYLTYLEEVRDEWVKRKIEGVAEAEDYVIARVAIDFRGQVRQADDVVVGTCELARLGRSSIATREVLRTADGRLAAEAEAVLVAWTRDTGESRPLTDDERAAFERSLL